jgi:hypothetical protein
MKLSKSDILAPFFGVSILAVLGYLLYIDLTGQSGPGNTKQIGKIVARRNIAERKYSTQVIWNEVFKNSKLYNFDTVRTADQSETVIRLNDGTEITLSENSMILLSLSEKEVDIKFMQGTINAKQTGAPGDKTQKVNIESGDSIISLKGGAVNLAQNKNDQIQMTVTSGTATLKTGDEEKLIKENQNILASKDSIRLYDLTIKLNAPENNRYVESAAKTATVNFSWERLKGNYSTYLEIANNPAVIDPLYKKNVNGAASDAALPEGVYYWRVHAINNANKKIEMSEIRKLTILNNRPVFLISPANKSIIKYRDAKPMINFLWSKNESISRYNLVISNKADMSSPMVNTPVEGNKISLNSLGQGAYFWKVININDSEQMKNDVTSPVSTFIVSKTETVEPPVPVSPADGKAVHPKSIVQKGLNFVWTRDPAVTETRLSIAEDKEFSKTLYTKSSRENFIRLSDALKDGTYYWSLRGVMRDKSTTDASTIRSFIVSQGGSITLIEPKDHAIILSKKAQSGAEINFSWSKAEIEGKYLLQVSRDRAFNKVSKEASVEDLSAEIAVMPEGAHFWRVTLIDDKGTSLLTSPVHKFELLSILDIPGILGPAKGSTIEMLRKETLDFFWKPVRGANLYRIGLYQIRAGIQYSVATMETRNTSYNFTDLKKLDVGNFIWTLQAIDIDPATNRMRRESEEIKTMFEIKLGIKGDLKMDTPNIINTE